MTSSSEKRESPNRHRPTYGIGHKYSSPNRYTESSPDVGSKFYRESPQKLGSIQLHEIQWDQDNNQTSAADKTLSNSPFDDSQLRESVIRVKPTARYDIFENRTPSLDGEKIYTTKMEQRIRKFLAPQENMNKYLKKLLLEKGSLVNQRESEDELAPKHRDHFYRNLDSNYRMFVAYQEPPKPWKTPQRERAQSKSVTYSTNHQKGELEKYSPEKDSSHKPMHSPKPSIVRSDAFQSPRANQHEERTESISPLKRLSPKNRVELPSITNNVIKQIRNASVDEDPGTTTHRREEFHMLECYNEVTPLRNRFKIKKSRNVSPERPKGVVEELKNKFPGLLPFEEPNILTPKSKPVKPRFKYITPIRQRVSNRAEASSTDQKQTEISHEQIQTEQKAPMNTKRDSKALKSEESPTHSNVNSVALQTEESELKYSFLKFYLLLGNKITNMSCVPSSSLLQARTFLT